MTQEALERAVEKAGGQSAFARMHGVSQPTVWGWLNNVKRLPAEFVLETERQTGISRHDLRPDIYPRDEDEPSRPFDGQQAAA